MDATDPDLSDATVGQISRMLTLAKSKHQEAMALLGTPDPNALPRLREVLRLLESDSKLSRYISCSCDAACEELD